MHICGARLHRVVYQFVKRSPGVLVTEFSDAPHERFADGQAELELLLDQTFDIRLLPLEIAHCGIHITLRCFRRRFVAKGLARSL
jgi:hypothetical protein